MSTKLNIFKGTRFYLAILLGLFILAYWVPVKSMVNVWMTDDDYSYGMLVPFITLYLLWDKRNEIKQVDFKTSWPVFPVLLLFFIISVYGILGSSGNVAMPSIPVMIILFAIFCLGIDFIKKALLPMGMLIFMVPLPDVLDRTFGVFLKNVSSKMGVFLVKMFGIPVYLSGNVIDLGVTQLQVVDACSGLRFVFPLLALGVIYSYFFEKVLWKKIFFVVLTVPIAIITNGLRIGITAILATYYGADVAEGFFHDFSGWAIFMVAFAFLFLVGYCMRKAFPEKSNARSNKPEVKDTPISNKAGYAGFTVSAILLVILTFFSWNTKAMPPFVIAGGMQSFPLKFSGWDGSADYIDNEIIIKSGAEEAFSGYYKNDKNDSVSLYIGYIKSAFMKTDNFFHSPTVCLPSSGWKVIETTTHDIYNVEHFGNISVIKMVMENLGTRELVYFWFQTKDKTSHDKNINRLHLAFNAIKKDNTYDLFIRPITIIGPNEDIKDAEKRLDQFVREMMIVLLKFLKDNQYVEGK